LAPIAFTLGGWRVEMCQSLPPQQSYTLVARGYTKEDHARLWAKVQGHIKSAILLRVPVAVLVQNLIVITARTTPDEKVATKRKRECELIVAIPTLGLTAVRDENVKQVLEGYPFNLHFQSRFIGEE
jgi:hypothetical protein